MSNILDGLEVPTIADVIKKYEVASKNSAATGNSLITKIKGLYKPVLSFLIPGAIIGGMMTMCDYAKEAEIKRKNIASIVKRYADIDGSGAINSAEEREKAEDMLSGIAESNNVKYFPANVRTYNKNLIDYHSGFYSGDNNSIKIICGLGEVEEWIKAYDQERNKGGRR